MDLILDTSAIINHSAELEELIKDENNTIIVPTTVLEELENMHKVDSNRRKYLGRTGLRFLDKYINDLEYVISDVVDVLPPEWSTDLNDNRILNSAKKLSADIATVDRGMKVKAVGLGLSVIDFGNSKKFDNRTGYKILEVDTTVESDNNLLTTVYDNTFDKFSMFENEYLIIRDLSCPQYDLSDNDEVFIGYKTIDIRRWANGEFLDLRLPPAKTIKPRNDLQKCALDLLYNKDIPVKFVLGKYGSGKTKLSATVAHHMTVEKEKYGGMYFVRQPVGAGKEIGFTPGTMREKTDEFFVPVISHMKEDMQDPMKYADSLRMRDKLETNIPFYMKGVDIKDKFIVVDEAEDLSVKDIKLIGSRVSENSCIVFCGDYNQAERDYVNDSGILKCVNDIKDDPLVGFVALDLDVRSEASKVFADL